MSGIVNNGKAALKKGAKRDPELYVLLAVMSGAFGLAGYYFGRNPTSATSEESRVSVAKDSMPWHGDAKEAYAKEQSKYKYHPGGDARNPPKDAPSALHSVVISDVTLPKRLHEKYNKWGREGY